MSDQWRGHTIRLLDGEWKYADGVPVKQWPDRPCGHCGRPNTPEGHDGCLCELPGVMNACCGHGDAGSAYLQFQSGATLQGQAALEWIREGTMCKRSQKQRTMIGNPAFRELVAGRPIKLQLHPSGETVEVRLADIGLKQIRRAVSDAETEAIQAAWPEKENN